MDFRGVVKRRRTVGLPDQQRDFRAAEDHSLRPIGRLAPDDLSNRCCRMCKTGTLFRFKGGSVETGGLISTETLPSSIATVLS